MPYRDLRPMAESLFSPLPRRAPRKLDDGALDRRDVCRDAAAELYGVRLVISRLDDDSVPLGTRAQWASFDARNITLEPEYDGDIDRERYSRVKPLIWLWILFDRSPLGQNAWLGIQLRRVLAERIFPRCGRNAKFRQFVEFTYGYNLAIGDDVVVHRCNRVSISDYVNIYSHTHDINGIRTVYLKKTVIGDHARVTYHETVLAGAHVGKDGMVGALALATKAAPGMEVSVGIPARPVRPKDRPCPYCEEEAPGASRTP